MRNTLSPLASVRVGVDVLGDYTAASSREWLVANGLGGYACGSLAGACTRRYHALLVAALTPPTGRRTALAKVEETLTVGPSRFELATNQYPGVVHPEGYRYLHEFRAWPVPTFLYSPAPGVSLVKRVWMADGANTTYVSYSLAESSVGAELQLSPLVCWKDHHAEMRAQQSFPLGIAVSEGCVAVGLAPDAPDLRLLHCAGQWRPAGYWHYNVEHLRELERGLDWREDLYCPGHLTFQLDPGQTVTLVATLEAGRVAPARQALLCRASRQRRLCAAVRGGGGFGEALALAGDAFVTAGRGPGRRGAGTRSAIVAGYPWFTDWGRDTMISLPGLCLVTGRERVARRILLSYARYVSRGMLPNRFPDAGGSPEYNTVDATLWYFEAVRQCADRSPEGLRLAARLWPALASIIRCHLEGTRFGIGVDPHDGLLHAGEPGVQLTWMDARVGDRVVTPRTGKPVEVNALWYNALCVMVHLGRRLGRGVAAYRLAALQASTSFRARFVRPDGLGLYDVLTADGPDAAVRPNQVFAVSLPFSPLTREQRAGVVDTVERQLVTPCGLRTLAPGSPGYAPRYEGDMPTRDEAYHQGTAWPWLLGPFALAHYRVHGDAACARAFLEPLVTQLTAAGVGYLPEVYDAEPPQRPGGCIAQAWSVAEALRAWMLLG